MENGLEKMREKGNGDRIFLVGGRKEMEEMREKRDGVGLETKVTLPMSLGSNRTTPL